jgi:protein involved in polysaccharide export with SLBB domain
MNSPSLKRWICLSTYLLAGSKVAFGAEAAAAAGEIAAAEPATPNVSLSVRTPDHRAGWQQRLTLGPGDVLNLSLFNMPETARTEVPISPDGKITFLQARDITAAGLTVDELRAKLDEALGKFYQNPRVVIVPAAIHSKKYFLLGSVANSGVYTFDRPLTLIEAIARAGGFQTGLSEQRSVELTDLAHSFVVRNGQRLPLDFERLFQRGDLSQNVALEPDDYLYFASANANEIYVLGEVVSPGVVAFAPKPTVLNVIAARGGYTLRAYKGRVLVVRGSLEHPQTFEIDTRAVLAGNRPDFKLEPKDIVYVSTNPWKVGGEVLDTAVRAFVQGFVVEATTLKVGPIYGWPSWGQNRTKPWIGPPPRTIGTTNAP